MNEYKFDDSKRAVIISKYNVPAPWINYLSNGRMHAFVSQAGGGFAWWKSSTDFRLTRYRTYNLPIDSPGFYVYIRQEDGTVWSPSFRPCETPLDEWSAIHKPGCTTFVARKGEVEAKLTLFMAMDYDSLVWDLKLINHGQTDIQLDVFAYVELSQLLWKQEVFNGYYWRHMLKTWHDEETDALIYLCHSHIHPNLEEVPLVYFASTLPVTSFSGDRDAFIGAYRDERNPICVENGNCGNTELSNGEPCAALQNTILLQKGEEKSVSFFLGIEQGALKNFEEAKKSLAKELEELRSPGAIKLQRNKLDKWWSDHFSIYDCNIPDEDARRQINIFSPINSVNTARYSRAVNVNASGLRGIGFRDSCQDMLAMAYRKPEWAEEMFLYLLSKQYCDGHTVHQIPFGNTELPDIKVRCDNHLWLPFLAYAIAAETGDLTLFQKQVPYLSEDHLSPVGSGSVWEHLLSAVRYTQAHIGAHGLPLTMHGDWNDIIGKFSLKGKGESIFAAQQYVVALKYLIEIAEAIETSKVDYLEECKERQEKAIIKNGWDNDRWIRCFDDEGTAIGNEQSKFGKLWLNPQSWSVLSGVGTLNQLSKCMENVSKQLDTGIGLKLLTPGFKTWPEETEPFTGYGPGCGENGGIFCHANTWAIIAEAILGNGNRAWKYFTQMIPHVALQKVGIERYQGEPYAWASNIVGPESKRFGWANVMHITGTASWMDVAATQYLLGVRPKINGLIIDPCIPENWEGFSVLRKFRGCTLDIHVSNESGVMKGVKSIIIDDIDIKIGDIPLIPACLLVGKQKVSVKVNMG